MTDDFMLELRDIEKSFSGVPVLKRASFSLRKGEVHALLGGNGAGKSTLMKIMTGVYQRDAGTIQLHGQAVELPSPVAAERHGIAMIFQEFSLIPTLTVAQNISLMHEPRARLGWFVDDRTSERHAREILKELGADVDPLLPVSSLSVGESQIVEIAKALSKKARILVMDEPTSSLSESETEKLFRIIHRLKSDGISIIYISHRMSEISAISDRVTVLRDGTSVLTADAKSVTMEELIASMLGSDNQASVEWSPRSNSRNASKPVLEVTDLSVGNRVKSVSFSLCPGEIVGLAGLTGSGRTEIAEAIFGIRDDRKGKVAIDGRPVHTVRDAIAAQAALVPENRRTQGLVLDHSLRANFMLPNLSRFMTGLFMNDRAGRRSAEAYIRSLKISTDGPEKAAELLSGGNQQKIVLAKWLERNPRLLILDEPTIGVDVGAKSEIVDIVRSIADRGAAVLVISSEFEELLAMSDRLLILHAGRIIDELHRQDIDSEETLHHAVQG